MLNQRESKNQGEVFNSLPPLTVSIKDFSLLNALDIFMPYFISHVGGVNLVIYSSFMHISPPGFLILILSWVISEALPSWALIFNSLTHFTYCFNEFIDSQSHPPAYRAPV